MRLKTKFQIPKRRLVKLTAWLSVVQCVFSIDTEDQRCGEDLNGCHHYFFKGTKVGENPIPISSWNVDFFYILIRAYILRFSQSISFCVHWSPHGESAWITTIGLKSRESQKIQQNYFLILSYHWKPKKKKSSPICILFTVCIYELHVLF